MANETNTLDNIQETLANDFSILSKASQSFVSFTGATGIAGFKFDISSDEEISLSSDITDHYTENNVPVQDNIVNKPVEVTLRGLVGEYKYIPKTKKDFWEKATEKAQNITQKLVTIGSYLPAISDFTMQTFDTLKQGNFSFESLKNGKFNYFGALDIATSAFELYRNINIPSNKQTSAFLFFEALWASKQTFTIQTPFRFYTNMAVKSLKAVQHGDTNDNSDFEITFKEIKKVTTSSITSDVLQGRLKEQSSSYINKGIAYCKEKSVEIFNDIFGGENATAS